MEPDRALAPRLNVLFTTATAPLPLKATLSMRSPCWLPLNEAENCLPSADRLTQGAPSYAVQVESSPTQMLPLDGGAPRVHIASDRQATRLQTNCELSMCIFAPICPRRDDPAGRPYIEMGAESTLQFPFADPANHSESVQWFGADGIRTGAPSLLPTNSTPRLPERKRGDELTGGLEPPACALQVRCSTR